MSDFLTLMTAGARRRVREAKARVGEAELLRREGGRSRAPALKLHASGFDVIAEIKFRSPSRGRFVRDGGRTAIDRAAAYARGGAAAVSVVTEPNEFAGSLEALAETAASCPLPTIRKDFLVEPYQVVEAKAYGASGVLLIARILGRDLLREMIAAAAALELFALVEAFDEDDLQCGFEALAGAKIVGLLGINARDLATLALDRARHETLMRRAPRGVPLVAESGLRNAADAAHIARLGYRAALIGGALMELDEPRALLEGLIASGRSAAARHELTP